jgi:hypothetical protein
MLAYARHARQNTCGNGLDTLQKNLPSDISQEFLIREPTDQLTGSLDAGNISLQEKNHSHHHFHLHLEHLVFLTCVGMR